MKLKIAIIGCGNISQQYGTHVQNYPEDLEIVGAYDLDIARAEAFCQQYGGRPFRTYEEVLAAPDVDVVVNLTIHRVHYALNRQALLAGKHVYSEKPMALTLEEAKDLEAVAAQKGVRIAAAPITYLGEGIQTMARLMEENLVGPIRLGYVEVNWGQIERWIPAPANYYTVGPLLDVGVYAITALTFLLGPVRSVWGYSAILKNPRNDKEGKEFPVTAPDFTTGVMEFENGVVVRLTTNYYVPSKTQRHLRRLEFHGDEGSLVVSDYHDFNPVCEWYPYAQQPIQIPLLRENAPRMDRAVGLKELKDAIEQNRPHRGAADHAAHVIEIMTALQTSADECRKVAVTSCFQRPPLMDWARCATLNIPRQQP